MATIDDEITPIPPERRDITRTDVMDALKAGLSDFKRAPLFGLFFASIFVFVGMIIWLQLMVWGTSYWALPLAAGFPLLGPFLAVGLYEVSRRMEAGAPLDWPSVLTVVANERKRQIPWMAFVALFFFLVWVYLAHLIFALSFGLSPLTNVTSSYELLMSGPGITMVVLGTIVGGALAFALFAVSAVSVPMFLDREIDVVTGMVTSAQVVLENPGPMIFWGAIVTITTLIGMVPLFLGMFIVFPVIGHASWHLYRKAIVPEGASEAEDQDETDL